MNPNMLEPQNSGEKRDSSYTESSLPKPETYEEKIKRLEDLAESKQEMLEEQERKYQEDLKLKEAQIIEERKRRKDREEEVRHYANSLADKERKYQEDLRLKVAQIEEERKWLSEEKQLQRDMQYYTSSYTKLSEDFVRYKEESSREAEKMYNSYIRLREEFNKYTKETAREAEVMNNRLASVFEKRLRCDQRKVENIAEFNTPSDVQADFKKFVDGDRIEAWDSIEKTLPPTEEMAIPVRYLAFIIFVTAFEEVEEAKDAVGDVLDNIIRQLILEGPRRGQELCHKRKDGCSDYPVTFEISVKKKEIETTPDLFDYLMLSLKQTAHSCDLGCFDIADVKRIVSTRWAKSYEEKKEMLPLPELPEKILSDLDDYIKGCIRLSWRLVTQVPPLQLEYSSLKFNKQKHNLSRLHYNTENSDLGQSDDIACYLWPALLEQGGKVIYPAEVLCKPDSL